MYIYIFIVICVIAFIVGFAANIKKKENDSDGHSFHEDKFSTNRDNDHDFRKMGKEAKKEPVQQLVNVLDNAVRRKTLHMILDRLKEFLDDDALTKICYNFVDENAGLIFIDYFINYDNPEQPQHNIDGDIVLFPYITQERFLSFEEFNSLKKSNDIQSIITISNSAFKNDILRWASTGAAKFTFDLHNNPDLSDLVEDDEENNEDITEDDDYYKILFFIKLLCDNEKISDSFIDEQAILYLLWITHKIYLENQKEAMYEKYNLNDKMSIEEKIEKIYRIEEDGILSLLTIDEYLKNLDKPLLLYRDELRAKVAPMIKKMKSRENLKRLENFVKNEKTTTLAEIDLMTGIEFENFIAELFQRMGYESKVTKASGDQGIDVIARKDGDVVAIQAKCYSGVVGNHAIMEAVAGMKYYKADRCMVISNSDFTRSARELAEANDVELWDRETLKEKIKYVGI